MCYFGKHFCEKYKIDGRCVKCDKNVHTITSNDTVLGWENGEIVEKFFIWEINTFGEILKIEAVKWDKIILQENIQPMFPLSEEKMDKKVSKFQKFKEKPKIFKAKILKIRKIEPISGRLFCS